MNYTHLFNFTKWDLYDSDLLDLNLNLLRRLYDLPSGPSDLYEISPKEMKHPKRMSPSRSNGKVPTVIKNDGKKMWLRNGKRHRDEINHKTKLTLPAEISSDGSKFWYFEGEPHRELTDVDPETGLTLPAIIFSDEDKFWWFEGKLHREITDVDHETGLTLPAAIWSSGTKFWYFEGKRTSESEQRIP